MLDGSHMFTIRHSDGSFIKKLFSIVIPALDVIPMSIESEGIKVLGISPDKMIMIKLTAPTLAFEEFSLDREAKLFLEKEDLKIAIKRLTKREKVQIEYKEGDRDLTMRIINPKTGLEKVQLIHLREEGEEPPGELEIEMETELQISSDLLSSIVKDIAIVSDEAEFGLHKSKLRIRSSGELMRYEILLEEGKGLLSISSKSDAVVSKYAIDLLKTVVKGLPKNTMITVSFGPSKPMRIYIPLEGGVSVAYWIAPRA
ncbi:MAG: hypothetical protein ABWJ42_00995 [Sulfolobales archaeon]